MLIKNNQLIFQCPECKNNYKKDYKELIKRFANTYKFCNGGINKFILLLRKEFILMNTWIAGKDLMKHHYQIKKVFYSEINLEDIADKDYAHDQKGFEEFKLKNLDDQHGLYVQSDTLLLADVFENFRKKCIEIYELDPAQFLSAPGLVWQACFKKSEVEIELLTNIDMLLMAEKSTRGRMCRAIHKYAKANNKYMKKYDKNKESSYIQYLDATNLHGWAMSQKPPVNGFEQVEELYQFKKDFIKIMMKTVLRDIFLKSMFNIQKIFIICIVISRFYQKERKFKNVASLFMTFMTRKTMLFT